MKRTVWFIFLLYISVRIYVALSFPIFNDESTYMRWGQGFLSFPDRWWAFMLDGKQPGVAILYGLSQLLPLDPLISMRLVSIVFSSLSFIFLYFLSVRIMKQKTTEFFLVLLAFCPYLIFFDALALPDSIVTTCFSLIALLLHSFVHTPNVWKGMLIGITVGFGWWFKSTILLSIPLIILLFVLYFPVFRNRVITTITGSLLGTVLGIIIVIPVLFNPNILYESTQVIQRTLTFSEILKISLSSWAYRVWQIGNLMWGLAGPFVGIGFLLSLFVIPINRTRVYILLWFVGPILLEVVLLKSLTGRLLVMSIPFLLLLVSQILDFKHGKLFGFALTGVTVSLGLLLTFSPLVFNKYLYVVSKEGYSDFGQYISGWTSGWGVKEAILYIQEKAQSSLVIVYVRQDGGNPEDAVISYMHRLGIPVFYITEKEIVENTLSDRKHISFFVSRGEQLSSLDRELHEEKLFPKPTGNEFVGVYSLPVRTSEE